MINESKSISKAHPESLPYTARNPQTTLLKKARKSRKSLRMIGYLALLLCLLQIPINYFISSDDVHHYRVEYNLFKDDPRLLSTALDKIAIQIEQQNLQDYLLVLGDSVTYGTPQSSDNSVAYYLEQRMKEDAGAAQTVFNLSMPAMQAGDLYTLLLMLDARNISTQNVIMDTRYSSFVARNPGPRIVFWLGPELKQLDTTSYNQITSHLKQNGYEDKQGLSAIYENYIVKPVLMNIPLYKYQDFIKQKLNLTWQSMVYGKRPSDALGDVRPWFMKENLKEILKGQEYVSAFDPKPFDMSEQNLHVLFMNKIIKHQENTRTLVFLSGTNEELSKEYIENSGYKDNLKSIDTYMANQPVNYMNLHGTIKPDLFSDHTHFTKEGYEQMASILWDKWQTLPE